MIFIEQSNHTPNAHKRLLLLKHLRIQWYVGKHTQNTWTKHHVTVWSYLTRCEASTSYLKPSFFIIEHFLPAHLFTVSECFDWPLAQHSLRPCFVWPGGACVTWSVTSKIGWCHQSLIYVAIETYRHLGCLQVILSKLISCNCLLGRIAYGLQRIQQTNSNFMLPWKPAVI